jgi:4-hydroxybenzoate polyprenyltransferase
MDMAVPVDRLRVYAGFVKLEHTVFSLPLIFAGALLALRGWPEARPAVLILLAAIGGRVVAMGLNRLIDAGIDARNPRTKRRELPRGAMRRAEAWLIVLAAGALYVAAAASIAPVCLALSPIPVALFVGYPYLKRFTALSHLGLGLAWSMAPLGGWLAAASQVPQATAAQLLARIGEVGWLWLFSVLWVAGFDIIYATMDESFDREAGLYSLPAMRGRRPALRVAAGLHGMAFLSLSMLWRAQLRTPAALPWLAPVAALFIWQHAIADRHPAFAFFQVNGLLGFVVLGFVVAGIAG